MRRASRRDPAGMSDLGRCVSLRQLRRGAGAPPTGASLRGAPRGAAWAARLEDETESPAAGAGRWTAAVRWLLGRTGSELVNVEAVSDFVNSACRGVICSSHRRHFWPTV